MINKRETSSITLCLDQIFIKTDARPIIFKSLLIVVESSISFLEEKIDNFEFNKPKKLNIMIELLHSYKYQYPVHIKVYLEEILFSEFEFVFIESIITSLHETKDYGNSYIRIIIRAFTEDATKFRIGSLHKYKVSDFEESNVFKISRNTVIHVDYSNEKRVLKVLKAPNIRNQSDPSLREVIPFISIPHHPSMIEIFGYFFNSQNQLIIVLENIRYGSLADLIEDNNKISQQNLSKIVNSMLIGLYHMHSYGLIHRDLSPDNILITEDYQCKIIDFGVSRFSDEPKLTQNVGKTQYMAPEVMNGNIYGKEADYFSVSKVLLELFEKYDPSYFHYLVLFIYNMNVANPEMRFNFNEMILILENHLGFDNEEIKIDENSLNEEKIIIFIDGALKFAQHIKDNQIIPELTSELLKVLLNNPKLGFFNDLLYQYVVIMLIGGIAFDLEISFLYPSIDLPIYEYDSGRLMYKDNTFIFGILSRDSNKIKNFFLDFDENVGFHPTKDLSCSELDIFALAIVYHIHGIVKMENDSGNPVLDNIISILDDCDKSPDLKFEECIRLHESLKLVSNSKNEIYQSIFCALADAGYLNMVRNAWVSLFNSIYGWKRAKKYFEIDLNNGNTEISHMKKFFKDEYNFKALIFQYKMDEAVNNNDIPTAFYLYFNFYNYINIRKAEEFNTRIYSLSIGYLLYALGYFDECIKYLSISNEIDIQSTIKRFQSIIDSVKPCLGIDLVIDPKKWKNNVIPQVWVDLQSAVRFASVFWNIYNNIKQQTYKSPQNYNYDFLKDNKYYKPCY